MDFVNSLLTIHFSLIQFIQFQAQVFYNTAMGAEQRNTDAHDDQYKK